MNLAELIIQLNADFPTRDLVIAFLKRFGPEPTENKVDAYINQRMIRLEESNTVYENEIERLINESNVQITGIGILSFYKWLDDSEYPYKIFASYNDYHFLCFNADGQIFYKDELSSDHILIAPSNDVFFRFLVVYNKYHKWEYYKCDFSVEEMKISLKDLVKRGLTMDLIVDLMPLLHE